MSKLSKRIACILVLLLAIQPFATGFATTIALGEDTAIGTLPGKQWELHDLSKTTVEKNSQITGEESPNKTQSRFGVWGTDLGSMAVIGDKTFLFGGDTFSDEKNAHWRSNVLFIIEDDDPSDGLTITDAVTDRRGDAKELLLSLKQDGTEMTVIPTNIFAVGETLYCNFMSVAKWGDHGVWTCRYSSLAKSEDLGQKWKKLNDTRWPGESNFIQMAHCPVGDTMYFWGIPGGRMGGVALMKAPMDKVEDLSAYSYYVGNDESGAPKWMQGNDGITQAATVIEAPVGEISVLYNEYLGNFIITYLNESNYAIEMREGITPWGEWSEAVTLVKSSEYPSLYGAYMHPKYVEQSGKEFYFAMSQFFPIYNIMWMKAMLE